MRKLVMVGVAAAAVVAGCGQGRAQEGAATVQRNFQVGDFQRLEVAGPYEVRVRTGAQPSVSGSGPEKLMERLVVEVQGDRLLIHPRKEKNGLFGWGSNIRGTAKLEVTVPMLRAASIAGSGDINVDTIRGDSFDGSIAGSGDLGIGSLSVGTLRLSIAGSGDIRAGAGQARRAEYDIAGSGDIDAGKLHSESTAVEIAGSGSVSAHASGTADVDIVGSGDVTLAGGAKCTVKKMGSGSVRCS